MQFLQIFFQVNCFSCKENQNLNVLGQVEQNEKSMGFLKLMEVFYFVVCVNFCLCFAAAGPHRGYKSNRNSSVNGLHLQYTPAPFYV